MKKNIIMLGAPGVGKGTQAQRIAEKYNWAHISTGDMLREEVIAGSDLGKQAKTYMEKGELVPDDLIVAMVKVRIAREDCQQGFILDGFPRTVIQAEKLDALLSDMNISLDDVISIDVDEEEIVARLSNRFVCEEEGKVVAVSGQDKCPDCGGKLIRRKDDEPETVRNRLKVYSDQTMPLIRYYEGRGLLRSVDGMGDINTIFNRIVAVLQKNAQVL